ncbi:MAG: polysulfide reductase NrfD [Anaerolineae bacterium]|nr:polysulfide reductase NrfD [Anaerolineae bacterium]
MTTRCAQWARSLPVSWTEVAVYLLLLALTALGLGVAVVRFMRGLGATTNLSNAYPWGIWITFDVFIVPFSAGAFTLAAVVYILNDERYHVLVPPVVLAGLLGYIMVCAVLLADLGLPHRFYNIIAFLNPESFMFEISWCVMLYTIVLVLEFSPVVLESLGWEGPHRLVRSFTVVFVSAGIILSSLHQSSLGSMWLLLQDKLHALWWTPLLPFLFLLTAIAGGLCMAILVSMLLPRAFGRPVRTHLLANLGRAVAGFLAAYGVLKLLDLLIAGELGLLFTGSTLSFLFWAELLVGVVGPVAILSQSRLRETERGLLAGASLATLGLALNRANISMFAIWRPRGTFYSPHWMEVAILVGAVAAAVLVLALAARLLPAMLGPAEEEAA